MARKITAKALCDALDTNKITAWMEAQPLKATAGMCGHVGRCVIANYLRSVFPDADGVAVCGFRCSVSVAEREWVTQEMTDDFRSFIKAWDSNGFAATRTFAGTLSIWRKHMYEQVAA